MKLLLLLACLLVGCADGALPPLSPDDPASPRAPEAPLPAETLPAASAVAVVHVHHHDAADPPEASPGAAYVCPMHADVVRDAPGTCPKCGMTLIPKPSAAKEAPR